MGTEMPPRRQAYKLRGGKRAARAGRGPWGQREVAGGAGCRDRLEERRWERAEPLRTGATGLA